MDVDLHIHTIASDGSFSPFEIYALARKRGLGAIAFTDHDTVDGVKTFAAGGTVSEVQFLPGVEITAKPPSNIGLSDSLHILGYGIRADDSGLGQLLSRLQKSRDDRTPLILDRLQKLGLDLTIEDLGAAFSGPQLGRPHIAQLMVRKEYVVSIDEAFDRYLGRGKPAYVDKMRVSCGEAIDAIHCAGGVAVLAHPGLYGLPDDRMNTLVSVLKDRGVQGLEIYYPEHSEARTEFYGTLARRFAMLVTGGTDFHGAVTPGVELGTGRGDFHVPYEVYEKLLSALG